MAFHAGMIVGQYRIDRKLGAGGMGEVYAATHLVLGREVALKTLPPHQVRSDSAVARFLLEARAAAALEHPNIVTVYDVADQDGILYIAMERVDGTTLRDLLAARTLRPLEAVRFAIQIANALAAAHAGGVLHRDVKPANIMVTRRNQIKVLDFGLAKGFDRGIADPETSPTLTTDPSVTETGQIAGTATYMSPEQAQGFTVDARSDIFSFGIVLYEMVTGAHPFDSPSRAGILANILRSEPRPLSTLSLNVPGELDDIIRFCLRKAPEDRAYSMHDIAFMLRQVEEAMERPETEAARPARRRRVWLFSGVAVAAAITAGWLVGSLTTSGRSAALAPKGSLRRVTWDAGLSDAPAPSNDGHLLAFASDRFDGKNLDLYVRMMNGGEPIRLTTDPADDTDPSFSPDGATIAFHSERHGGGIYVIPSFGGQERLVAARGNRPRFSPDGKWIAYWVGEEAPTTPSGRIYIVPARGGPPLQLQPAFAAARYPVWTPDGSHLLFEGVDVWKSDTDPRTDWWVTPLNGGAAVKTGAWDLMSRTGPDSIYEPGGWHGSNVIFSGRDNTQRSVYEIPVSTRTWKVQGPPRALTFGTGTDGVPNPSPAGAIAFSSYQYEINVWSGHLDENGRVTDKQAQKVTTGDAYHSAISMDTRGTRMVYLLGRPPNRNVWIRELATGRETAVSSDDAGKCAAVLSPDGSQVAWSVCGPGKEPVYIARIGGDLSVSIPEMVCDDCGRVADWPRGGDSILFVDHSSPTRVGILSPSSHAHSLIASSRYSLDSPRFSPDGNWLALTAVHSGGDRAQIFVIPMQHAKAAPESAWIAVTSGDSWDDKPVWPQHGDALLFYSRRDGFGCIWRQALNRVTRRPDGPPAEALSFHGSRLSLRQLSSDLASLSASGDELVFTALESTGSVWVLDKIR